jgi:cytochrome c1
LTAGGALFAASGIYNIAADEPHLAPVRWLLRAGRTRSVEFHSRGIQAPRLHEPEMILHGFGLYRINCEPCHGAPGIARRQLGRGINPNPPPLMTAVANWTDAQLHWIVSHGLKMSGMPSFAARLSERDRWAIVAFLRRLQTVSAVEYQSLAGAAADGSERARTAGDYGFARLRTQGNPERGRTLLRSYGCTACHAIPGNNVATVGPPLTDYAERQFIAGSLVNVPANLIAWIVNPQGIEPNTAMPNLAVPPNEAMHMAAYLYTLGESRRLDSIRRTVAP